MVPDGVIYVSVCLLIAIGHASASSRFVGDQYKLAVDHWLKAAAKHMSRADTTYTPSCSADYGPRYIERWRTLQGAYCNSSSPVKPTAGSPLAVSSRVQCYAHPEADISVCSAHNAVLTSSLDFLGDKDSGIPGLPNPAPGSIQLACQQAADPKSFLRGRLQSNEGSRMWLVQAPHFASNSAAAQDAYANIQQSCSLGRRVQHPVLMVTRVDPENAFHNLEGVISVFAALAVVQTQIPKQAFQQGLEVVVADDRLPGYFLDIWRRLSHPFPLRILRQQPYPDNTCFSTLLLAPYTAHTQSLLTYKAGTADEVVCESVILQAASMWLRHLFRDLLPTVSLAADTGGNAMAEQGSSVHSSTAAGTGVSTSSSSSSPYSSRVRFHGPAADLDLANLQPTPTQSQPPLQQLYVLWLSRTRFERQHQSELTAWQQARQLPAEQQEQLLVEAQRAVLQWNQQTCVPGQQQNCTKRTVMFSLQVAELSELSFYPDQLSVFMKTGVLMGVHGAGLANQIYMKPHMGALIEVWFNMENNYHYHNMAHMLAHSYYNVRSEEQLDISEAVKQLDLAMDAVADKHAAAVAAAAKASWWKRGWSG